MKSIWLARRLIICVAFILLIVLVGILFSGFQTGCDKSNFCPAGSATITLVQSNSGGCANTQAFCTCTLSSAAQNDLIILGLMWGNTTGTLAVTDNQGSTATYTAFTGTPPASTSDSLFAVYSVNPYSTASTTYTMTVSGAGNHTTRIACFDYHSTTGWQSPAGDVFNTAASTSQSNDTAMTNITPAAANELIWFGAQTESTITGSYSVKTGSPSGCTLQDAGGTPGTGWNSASRADSIDVHSGWSGANTCNMHLGTSGSTGYSAWEGAFKPN